MMIDPATLSTPLVAAVLLGGLGAIFGSFIAALVIRWPQDRSVVTGRSTCDHCGRVLGPIELIPLLGAMLSRGRCRSCGAAIDPIHWRIEACAVMIGATAGIAAPTAEGCAGAVFGWLLLALAALDIVAFWLPDRLTGLLAIAGAVGGIADIGPIASDRLIGGMFGYASLWLIATGYRALRGREGMGGADPKLFGAIGLWLGWQMLPAILLIASMIGLGVALSARMRGNAVTAATALPFGALLAIAAYPAWLFMVTAGP